MNKRHLKKREILSCTYTGGVSVNNWVDVIITTDFVIKKYHRMLSSLLLIKKIMKRQNLSQNFHIQDNKEQSTEWGKFCVHQ